MEITELKEIKAHNELQKAQIISGFSDVIEKAKYQEGYVAPDGYVWTHLESGKMGWRKPRGKKDDNKHRFDELYDKIDLTRIGGHLKVGDTSYTKIGHFQWRDDETKKIYNKTTIVDRLKREAKKITKAG